MKSYTYSARLSYYLYHYVITCSASASKCSNNTHSYTAISIRPVSPNSLEHCIRIGFVVTLWPRVRVTAIPNTIKPQRLVVTVVRLLLTETSPLCLDTNHCDFPHPDTQALLISLEKQTNKQTRVVKTSVSRAEDVSLVAAFPEDLLRGQIIIIIIIAFVLC